jgi:alpha-galactosidase
MRDALNATGRAIFFSMCEWGVDNPATWAAPVGNSWRTTGDISDNWASMTSRIDQNDLVHEYAAPGGWNDPDMLEVGNGGLTSAESVAHFSLWALAKAPLLIGCDLASMSNETLAILTNREVIAVNQDPLGVQGYKRSSKLGLEVWAGPLVDDAVAVVLFNRRPLAATITFDFALVGAQGSQYAVRDLWLHKDLGLFQGQFSYQVDAHGAAMLKLSPASRDE